MINTLFDPTIEGLNKSLEIRSNKQNVHAANIANANTPGFKAKKIEFENALKTALENAEASSLGDETTLNAIHDLKGITREIAGNGPSMDGNTVNVDQESARMVENEILYDTATKLLQKKLGLLKYTISESSRN